ncbi:Ig-like domain-containing protein [Photobacterium damselae subsp. piscicida]|nr:Ig-like domain-containing protein [Photobacterium damselae subsp. piscicida]MDP2570237.1 Ig-like domain-containing protein [Photobacterium damselae subsp. piscicida]
MKKLGVIFFLMIFLFGCQDESTFNEDHPTVEKLQSIVLLIVGDTQNRIIPKGFNIKLKVTGIYDSGKTEDITSTVNWNSSIENIVKIKDGNVTGVNIGETSVNAIIDGIKSNTITLQVTDAVLESIQLTPTNSQLAKGNSLALSALGVFSDKSVINITNKVKFDLSKEGIVTINGSSVKAVNLGDIDIIANYQGIKSNRSLISVTDAQLTSIQLTSSHSTISKGYSSTLKAIGIYSDNTTSDITSNVKWNISNPVILTIKNNLVYGETIGEANVTATLQTTVSNPISIKVTNAIITAINISPDNLTLGKGETATLSAKAIFSDGTINDITKSVSWNISDNNIAAISDGNITALNLGKATVTATNGSIISNTTSLTVSSAVLKSIRIRSDFPDATSIFVVKGQKVLFNAEGIYSDNSKKDITSQVNWISSNPSIAVAERATVHNVVYGQVTGVGIGQAQLMATSNNIESNKITIKASGAILIGITVKADTNSIAKGNVMQVKAEGEYSDGIVKNITDSVNWISQDSNIATVDNGLVKGVNVGNVSIEASQGSTSSNQLPITITDAVLSAIDISPKVVNLLPGNSQEILVKNVYSDGSTNLTYNPSSLWSSSDSNVAGVSIFLKPTIVAKNSGLTQISLTDGNIKSNTISVNVCGNLAGPCLGIVQIGNKKMTNSPSLAYLSSLEPPFDSYMNASEEGNNTGPHPGKFVSMTFEQGKAWCSRLNTIRFNKHITWRIATDDELKTLFNDSGDMFASRGWPVGRGYYGTLTDGGYFSRSLLSGITIGDTPPETGYISCVVELRGDN